MSTAPDKVGAYWSSRQSQKAPTWNWWTNGRVLQHINRLVCGEPVNGFSRGLYKKALCRLSGQSLNCGISIGCGTARKEMDLLASGVVEKMVCYELSTARIEAARQEASRRSLTDRIQIHHGNAFEKDIQPEDFDLVFWNNALHHMPDTAAAVRWSRKLLSEGGMLLLDDYVGPNRIQFSDLTLGLANEVRGILPEKYLIAPSKPQSKATAPTFSPRHVERPNLARITARDPSEATDSEGILPAIAKFFPEAEVIPTGGSVYFAALPPLYANFDPSSHEDNAFLDKLLSIDESHVKNNPHDTLYAVAIAHLT